MKYTCWYNASVALIVNNDVIFLIQSAFLQYINVDVHSY